MFDDKICLFEYFICIDRAFLANDYYEIDWNTVINKNKFPEIKPKPFGKRLEEPVTDERYHTKIVIPWYRPENFKLVTLILII